MTYLCLSKVTWIRAAVVMAGVTDLQRNARERPDMKTIFKKMFGGQKKDLVVRSAVKWADKFCKTSPLLIMHGTNDQRVNPRDSLDLSAKLLGAGIHHSLVMFEGDDHILMAHRKQRWQLTKEWFDRYLKRAEKIHLQIGT